MSATGMAGISRTNYSYETGMADNLAMIHQQEKIIIQRDIEAQIISIFAELKIKIPKDMNRERQLSSDVNLPTCRKHRQ